MEEARRKSVQDERGVNGLGNGDREGGRRSRVRRVTFLLCTLPELNGEYWVRRGYEVYGGSWRGVGEWGAGKRFWVDWMRKVIDV